MIRTNSCSRFCFALGVVVALLMTCCSRAVYADGGIVPLYGYEGDIEMPNQKAIVVYDEEAGREELILSVKLLGETADAAWVVPVPSLPEVNTAQADWFVQLSRDTQPYEVISAPGFPCCCAGTMSAPPPEVEVISREQVGVYDVSVLSASEPGALLEWLNKHGYVFPQEGEPILATYVDEGGWYFVATRVLPGETAKLDGDVQPLWFSFDIDVPVYPMRLTALVHNVIDVLIYVLADHRTDIQGFDTEFAGELQLDPVDGEGSELRDLLSGRSYYVTRLRDTGFDATRSPNDLYIQRAPTDEPYRMVSMGGADARTYLLSYVYASPVVLGLVGFYLMKRRYSRP